MDTTKVDVEFTRQNGRIVFKQRVEFDNYYDYRTGITSHTTSLRPKKTSCVVVDGEIVIDAQNIETIKKAIQLFENKPFDMY